MQKEKTKEEKIGYRQILTQREYCKLLLANAINRFGDSVDGIAFTWLTYQLTESASWSAFVYMMNVLPGIFLRPFAGAAVEHRSKKKVMVLSDVLRGMFVAVLVANYLNDTVTPWMMALLMVAISTTEVCCLPASTAAIPKVLEEKYYEFGISLDSVISSVMELVGVAAGGLIIGVWGIKVSFLIDVVTFFVSAVIKMSIKMEERVEQKVTVNGEDTEQLQQKKDSTNTGRQYVQTLTEGFLYVKDKNIIRNFCIMIFMTNVAFVPFNSLKAPLVTEVLGVGKELMSVIAIAMLVGIGIGSAVYPYLSKRCSVRTFYTRSGLGLGVGLAAMTWGSFFVGNRTAVYAITALAAFGVGFFCSLTDCTSNVQVMKNVEEGYLARATALIGAASMAAMPITSLVVSVLLKFVSVKTIMSISGVFCVIIYAIADLLKIELEEEENYEARHHLEQAG